MDKFLEKFAKIPALQKLLGLGVVILVVFGVTYSVFVQSAIDEIAANDAALETKRKKQMHYRDV